MQKVIYVALQSDSAPVPDGVAILDRAQQALAAPRFRGVTVQLARRDIEIERDRVRGVVLSQVAAGISAPPARRLVALISLWVDSADDLAEVSDFLTEFTDDVHGFRVTETVSRWWPGPEGPPAGGVNAVTLMRRNAEMTWDRFQAHWAQVHMPISLRYHPQWRYLRNVVDGTLAGDPSSAPDAIAEEGFASPTDLVDPMLFYGVDDGRAETLARNKAIVFEDVPLFLDIASTETFVTEEHVIRRAFAPYALSGDRGPTDAAC